MQVLVPAEALLRGTDPFILLFADYVPYPLTAALLGVPFTLLSPLFGASLLTGAAAAWLAYLLAARTGNLWPLLVFCSFPFFDAVVTVQLTPLIVALALAGYGPLALLIKPQNALPLLITYQWRRRALVLAGLVLCSSLLLMPSWPWQWLARIKGYQGAVAILSGPGPLVLLAGLCWEQPAARLLILLACCPQRGMYDALALWLVPQTRGGMLTLTLVHWVVVIALALLIYLGVWGGGSIPFWTNTTVRLASCFLPALAVLLWEQRAGILSRLRRFASVRTRSRR